MDTIADTPSVTVGTPADTEAGEQAAPAPPAVNEKFSWWEVLFECIAGLLE